MEGFGALEASSVSKSDVRQRRCLDALIVTAGDLVSNMEEKFRRRTGGWRLSDRRRRGQERRRGADKVGLLVMGLGHYYLVGFFPPNYIGAQLWSPDREQGRGVYERSLPRLTRRGRIFAR